MTAHKIRYKPYIVSPKCIIYFISSISLELITIFNKVDVDGNLKFFLNNFIN